LETVGDETVVFDRTSQKAYRLNRPATIMWRHCDGKTSVEDLAGILKRELSLNEPAQPLAEMALQKLESMGLLEGPSGVTRREMNLKIAAAAAMIPIVAAITVPTPAKASSGGQSQSPPSPPPYSPPPYSPPPYSPPPFNWPPPPPHNWP